jgi:protein-L-isoaspartate(D-aspartate) O-methyltransferase
MKIIFIILFVLSFATVNGGAAFGEMDYASERLRMVREQLIARDIKDERVLDVMSLVERQKFVPETMKEYAYDDMVIAIGGGETLAQPYSVALIAQLLKLQGKEKILEVGTGSGYQTAVLAELAKEVYTVETIEALRIDAEKRFEALGYRNIRIKTGSADEGWKEYAPFDAVIISYPISYIPQKLIDQLEVSGKLIIHIGDRELSKALVVEKQAGSKLKKCDFKGTLIAPIVGEKPTEEASQSGMIRGENKKWKTSEGSKWKTKQ